MTVSHGAGRRGRRRACLRFRYLLRPAPSWRGGQAVLQLADLAEPARTTRDSPWALFPGRRVAVDQGASDPLRRTLEHWERRVMGEAACRSLRSGAGPDAAGTGAVPGEHLRRRPSVDLSVDARAPHVRVKLGSADLHARRTPPSPNHRTPFPKPHDSNAQSPRPSQERSQGRRARGDRDRQGPADMEAYDEGVLTRILVQEGASVPIGVIDGGGCRCLRAVTGARPPPSRTSGGSSPGTRASLRGAGSTPVHASPLARELARKRGVDPAAISGSCPSGRIVRADIEHAARENEAPGRRRECFNKKIC